MSGPGGFNLGDLGNLNFMEILKKAREFKETLEKTREELRKRTVQASAGGGMVVVTADGDGMIRSVRIDPAAIVPSEKELLEDLIQAAVNEARTRAKKLLEEEMAKLTAGLPIPPGFFGGL
ncbi:MAG: YbaB/EbfC family nucleoid-associated protein [Planctomycetes bacterium]|nr:YbaB/EbfC family nucleoid-associated protein [Planctomycetota bacterium]